MKRTWKELIEELLDKHNKTVKDLQNCSVNPKFLKSMMEDKNISKNTIIKLEKIFGIKIHDDLSYTNVGEPDFTPIAIMGVKMRKFAQQKYQVKKGKELPLLAKDLGIRYTTLHQYIIGRNQPGLVTLRKLYKLGCDINWYLDDSKE